MGCTGMGFLVIKNFSENLEPDQTFESDYLRVEGHIYRLELIVDDKLKECLKNRKNAWNIFQVVEFDEKYL